MQRTLSKTIENKLLTNKLWANKIKQDCTNQDVFLAIRDNRLDLYHNGGKLFSYDTAGFKTHLKYASVITANDRDYLSESELSTYKLACNFEDNYQRIKENCSNYSGIEASGVSDLYHKHSYLAKSDVVVLDIEISFESLKAKSKQDRIDILLYNKNTQILQFVEAKHFSNKEIWSEATPKVINQIKRYEAQIIKKKSDILLEYSNYINAINSIFNISLPKPTEIEDKVTLLIFGFDNDQKKGRLKNLIFDNTKYNGTKIYAIGNIKEINPTTLWKAKVL